MSLTPGTRLGPYEIAAQIGVGGMGGGVPRAEYKARAGRGAPHSETARTRQPASRSVGSPAACARNVSK